MPHPEEEHVCFLHAQCRFKVIYNIGENKPDVYHEETPSEMVALGLKKLLGCEVKRVSLSDKNDLWIDFGEYWVVFATFENGKESWRLFTVGDSGFHLVASDSSVLVDLG